MRADLKPQPWRPILTGERAERAWRSIERIRLDLTSRAAAEIARAPQVDPSAPSWPAALAGWSGVALFFAYLDQARPETGAGDQAVEFLEQAIHALEGTAVGPGLHAGFTGLGWVVEHLSGGSLAPGEEDAGAEIAGALAEHVAQSPWLRSYDVALGLAGFGIYALERLPRAGGRDVLERIVDRLQELAEPAESGVTWHTGRDLLPPQEWGQFPDGNYNLGVAHGVPGVISLLAEIHAAGVETARVGPLLAQAVGWLLAQKLPPQSGSVFPYSVADGVDPKTTGPAWCYGDLGVALALLGAARRMGEPSWEREAIEIGRGVAARPIARGGRIDGCLCHGAAGNGHLFNRLFQATGEPLFERAALAWFERAFELEQSGAGIGGFQFWDVDEQENFVLLEAPGFLNGSAGVGLALLAATMPVEPLWDRLLAVTVPPASQRYSV